MSFGEDLWDGFEKVNKRVDDGLNLYKDIAEFFKRRSKIESGYANELQALVKAAGKNKGHYKGSSLTGSFGTAGDTWVVMQEETEKLAKFHMDLSAKLDEQICLPIGQFVKEMDKMRNAHCKEGLAKQKNMNDAVSNLQKAKQKFHKLSKDAEDAQVASERARTDDTMKPQQISRLVAKASQASEKAKQSDSEYQECVSATNVAQTKYIKEEMPKVLSELQKMEENRIDFMQNTLKKFLLIQEAVPPCIELVCQTLSASVSAISRQTDIQQFIEDTKTGEQYPPAFEYVPFEGRIREDSDFSAPDAPGDSSGGGAPGQSNVNPAEEAIINDNEDLSHLSIADRKNRLEEKVEEAKTVIKAAIKSKKGLDQLIGLYDSQPQAKAKVNEELAEAKERINQLRDKKHEWEALVQHINDGGDGLPAGASSGGGSRTVLFQVRALYPYTAQESTELSFDEGVIMDVVNEYEGWWDAEYNGQVGLIPSTYVERI